MGRHTTVGIAGALALLGAGCVGLKYATEGRDAGDDAVVDASADVVADVAPDVVADVAPDVVPDVAPDIAPDVIDVVDVRDVAVDVVDASDRVDAADAVDVLDAMDVTDVMDVADVRDGADVVDASDGMTTDGDSAVMRADAADVNCAPNVVCGTGCSAYCATPGGSVVQRSCIADMVPGCGLMSIGGNTFRMGGDTLAVGGAIAVNGITVQPLYVDRYEVTVGRFRRFWAELGGRGTGLSGVTMYPGSTSSVPVTYDTGVGYEPTANSGTRPLCNWTAAPIAGTAQREDKPLNCVGWATAMAFCSWDAMGGNPGRLPTEAEWEWIARGSMPEPGLRTERSFPWGEEMPTCARVHHVACSPGGTVVGDTLLPTYGLFSLSGNVAEWTADVFLPYSDVRCWGPNQRNPLCLASSTTSLTRTLRGGHFLSDANNLRGAARAGAPPVDEADFVGFRCVRSL